MYEVRAVLKYEYYSKKDSWEQARLIAYLIAQVNSKKSLKQSDIINFYWDNEQQEKTTYASNEDKMRLQKRAQKYIELLNG